MKSGHVGFETKTKRNASQVFGTSSYWVQTCLTTVGGWMEAEGGSEVTLTGFTRWRWCPGGQLHGQTAPAGRRWHQRGWALKTWDLRWSCRLPGRLPAPPPDGPDAQKGRDTFVHWVLRPENWKVGASHLQWQQQMRWRRLKPEVGGSERGRGCCRSPTLSASSRTL